MRKLTQTMMLLLVASLFLAACNKAEKVEETNDANEAKAQIKVGEIDEKYDAVKVDGFKIQLLSTEVKDDTLTLHLKVKNTTDKKKLFDAFVLNVQNSEAKNLTSAVENNIGETIKAGKEVEGTVSFTAAGKGPFTVEYDDLENDKKELWKIER